MQGFDATDRVAVDRLLALPRAVRVELGVRFLESFEGEPAGGMYAHIPQMRRMRGIINKIYVKVGG